MKQKLLLNFVAAAAGFAFLVGLRADAQPSPEPPGTAGQPGLAPSNPQAPPPGGFRGAPPWAGRGSRPNMYMRSIADLEMTKRQLQHATNDLGGHRDSALAACDKAIEELQAVRAYTQTNAPHWMPPNGQRAPVPAAPAPAPAPQ